jgi:hypothetical protein
MIPETRARIIALRLKGRSFESIARETGLSRQRCQQITSQTIGPIKFIRGFSGLEKVFHHKIKATKMNPFCLVHSRLKFFYDYRSKGRKLDARCYSCHVAKGRIEKFKLYQREKYSKTGLSRTEYRVFQILQSLLGKEKAFSIAKGIENDTRNSI